MAILKVEKESSKYHSQRKSFAIINGELKIASEEGPQSHSEWFIYEGWIRDENDPLFEEIVRGMIDPKGDLYFYVGKNLEVNPKSQEIFFKHLQELVNRLNIPLETKVGGGMIKGNIGEQWPPRKSFGTVKNLIK